jgi:small GTP-binding protein
VAQKEPVNHDKELATYMLATTRMSPRERDASVAFVGASNVGKTTLIMNAIHGRTLMPRTVVPTIQDDHYTRFNSGTQVMVVDTSGSHVLMPLAAEQLATCSVAVMVFDPRLPETIEALWAYAQTLASFEHQTNVPLILVANKMDLVRDCTDTGADWQRHLPPQSRRALEWIRGSVERSFLVETYCEGRGSHESIMQLRDLIASQLPLYADRPLTSAVATTIAGPGSRGNSTSNLWKQRMSVGSGNTSPYSESPRTPTSAPTSPHGKGSSPRADEINEDRLQRRRSRTSTDSSLGYDVIGALREAEMEQEATARAKVPSPTTSPRFHESKCNVQ